MLEHPENPEWENFSVEFCGGTHLSNTLDAASFCLVKQKNKK